MDYRRLGNSGLRVSAVGLGSWLTFGRSVGIEGAREIVRTAVDLGVNFFDTADVYALGAGEETLAAALAGIPRKDYVLASKCFFPTGEGPNDRGLSRKHVMESCAASLRRLRTDYLDLYQCHRYDPETPLLETIRAMDDLIRRGDVLYWGVSCWSAEQIEETFRLCERHGLTPPISNQPPYNLFERGIERDVLPACRRLGVGQVVFSPLAQGVLSGKYAPGKTPPPDSRAADERSNRFIGRYLNEPYLRAAERIAAVAREAGLTPAALALAWCLHTDGVASVIAGARTPEQARENATAGGIRLSDEILERLAEIVDPLPPVAR